MNAEFIIGTVLGVVGASTGIDLLIKKIRKSKADEYFAKVCDHKTLDTEHRKALKKLSKALQKQQKRPLKQEYIDNFVLGKRGKEAVLLDICIQNDWVLTLDLCKQCLTYESPKVVEKYLQSIGNCKMEPCAAKENEQQ